MATRTHAPRRSPRPGFYAGGPNPQRERAERRAARAAAPQPFDARRAMRRAGISAQGEAREIGRLGAGGARGFAEASRVDRLGVGEFVLYAFASILGLALLDTALKGRGPAGVETILATAGGSIRRLFAAGDPIFGATAPIATVDTSAYGETRGITVRPDEGTRGPNAATPAPRGLKIIGRPYQGTHNLGNWQSDNAYDVSVPFGTPIYAPANATVARINGSGQASPRDNAGRFGGFGVTLNVPGDELFIRHVSRLAPGVRAGASLRAGQLIGYSGVGNGSPHAHVGALHDPARWLLSLFRPAGAGTRR